jgi:hypothetical protein
MSVWGEESALEPAVDTTTTEPNPDEGQEDPGAPNPADNESSQEQPPRLFAGKYKDRGALLKGIVNKAAMLLEKGEIDESPLIRKDATDEELEAMYRNLGKKPRGQAETQPSATEEPEEAAEEDEDEEDGETPPTEDYETAVGELQALVELAQRGFEGTPPVQQVQQPAPQQPQQVQQQDPQQQPTFDEPEADLAPVYAELRTTFGDIFGDEGTADMMTEAVMSTITKATKALIDREARILNKGLTPFIQGVNSYLYTEQASKAFNTEFKAFVKAHPEYADAKETMRAIWLQFPNVQKMKGGKNPLGHKMPTAIEFCARMTDAYRKTEELKQPKKGLRVASGAATKPRVAKPQTAESVTRQQLRTPVEGPGIWG